MYASHPVVYRNQRNAEVPLSWTFVCVSILFRSDSRLDIKHRKTHTPTYTQLSVEQEQIFLLSSIYRERCVYKSTSYCGGIQIRRVCRVEDSGVERLADILSHILVVVVFA